jgi:uncharacterized repeat protein (TIGR03803 family)
VPRNALPYRSDKNLLTWLVALAAVAASAQISTVIKNFGIPANITGFNPSSHLVQGPDGTLYGTTAGFEGNIKGTVFKVNSDGSGFTALKWFTNSVDGSIPLAGLTLSGGTLYGTTSQGGLSGNGTVFKVSTDGTDYTVLKHFPVTVNNGLGTSTNSDGANPQADLTLSGTTLYGTTCYGGSSNYGTVFKVNTDGTGFTNLHSFTAMSGPLHTDSDGANPQAGLALSGNTLYGTTANGGSSSDGTVFKVDTDGTGFANLHSFTATFGLSRTNTDGANPQAGLILSGGTLYGTAYNGGNAGNGTVFTVSTDGTGYTVIEHFLGYPTDGGHPRAGLTLWGSTLYGTTYAGGSPGYGTVFKVNTDGTGHLVLKNFTLSDGANPNAGLTLSGSTLFGTASSVLGSGWGAVFKVNTDGTGFTNLHSFTATSGLHNTNSDGANPAAALALSGSTLYGTAPNGGGSGNGTVFKVNMDGTGFTNLHGFTAPSGLSSTNGDGANPAAGLALSGNTLYGTSPNGGSSGSGTVFRVNTDGTGFTTLHGFTAMSGLSNTNGDGANPAAGLALSGSTLYGTTPNGGSSGSGTVFRVNTDGTGFTTLHGFTAMSGLSNTNRDGANPAAGLALSGSTLYGTTPNGGSSGSGTVFRVNTDGTGYTVLKNFTGSDGANPAAGVTLSGSMLYGTTEDGGSFGIGTVFSLNVAPVIAAQLLGSGDVRLSVAGMAGANYALDRSFSLSPAYWQPQATNPADAGGVVVLTNTPNKATNNFWRIRCLP